MTGRQRSRSASSSGTARRLTEENPDVFSDDYAIEDMGVADGFRPENSSSSSLTRTVSNSDSARTITNSTDQEPDVAKDRTAFRSGLQDYRLSRVSQAESSQRPLSMVSGFSLPRTQSPLPNAPSHPYGMYPQDTSLNRSSTTSTVRSDRLRPAHNYSAYQQTTLSNVDTHSNDVTSVGFPGLSTGMFRRREGEEADDILGPDGHIEQLPPYTRYPTGAKERYSGPPEEPSTASTTQADEPREAPRSPLMAAFEEERAEPEVMTSREKWAERSKRKTCFGRLPMWVIILGIVAIVAFAGLLGGLIGHYVGKHSADNDDTPYAEKGAANTQTVKIVTQTYFDAVPLTSTPSHLPSPPTGSFIMPIIQAQASSSDCLNDPSQQPAWGCPSSGALAIDVSEDPDGPGYQINVRNADPDANTKDAKWQYGPQVPDLGSDDTDFQVMGDTDQPGMGPAYWFSRPYDKIVILPENTFDPPGTKRSISNRELHTRDNTITPGSKVWICYWNQTIFQGFLFVQHDNGASSTSGYPASATPSGYKFKRNDGDNDADDYNDHYYPKTVKMEERREGDCPVQPYCVMRYLLDDNTFSNPPQESDPPMINLQETEPAMNHRFNPPKYNHRPALGSGGARRKRNPIQGACLCEWMTD